MMSPLSQPKARPTAGTTMSTPTTPNLAGTCAAASHQAAAAAAASPASARSAGPLPGSARPCRTARPRRPTSRGRAPGRRGDATDRRQDREGQEGGARRPVIGEQHGAEHRAQRHDRADRQVDAAGQDHERHADRDDAVVRHLPQHVREVAGAQEDVDALRRYGGRDDADREQDQEAPVEFGPEQKGAERFRGYARHRAPPLVVLGRRRCGRLDLAAALASSAVSVRNASCTAPPGEA